jgi:hypothetical protein
MNDPFGENSMALTGFLKLKWWRTMPRRKLTRRALPSVRNKYTMENEEALTAPSSTLIRMFPSGLRAITAIFLRFWKAKVKDLLLGGQDVS